MLQCVHNGRFLFRRALWHFGIFLLRQMIVLANLQPALPLNLGDMQGRYLQASMLQYIRFDLVIDDFALRRSQIQLISIQLHLDMLLSIEFGQQAHRLNGIPFVPQKFRNFPAILEHRKIQANPL